MPIGFMCRSGRLESHGGMAPPHLSARVRLARRAGMGVSALSRLSGRGAGGVVGGRVTMSLAPNAVRELSRGREVVLVSGTNGKTTTSALLTAALRTLGPVATNADGANTPAGLLTTLATATADRVVLEADEGWLPWAVDEIQPRVVVLLNLSRDQLDRHHEVGLLAAGWDRAMSAVEHVVANCDDPDTVWPAMAAGRQTWVAAGQRWTQDTVSCPRCGDLCRRDGAHWGCACGLRRPQPDWWLDGDRLISAGSAVDLHLGIPGEANRANAAMAVATAAAHGVAVQPAVEAMRAISAVAGRYAVHDYRGRQARLLLAKNPAGWLEALEMVSTSRHPVVIAFNSDGVDGRDPSWLYDVPFAQLADRRVVVIGKRATDMLVRLQLDGLTHVETLPGLTDALASLPAGPVDVLANYTAFQSARRELAHVR
jgi:lipid II isoglutaminyl synthase (glutamine-hydrolysing)